MKYLLVLILCVSQTVFADQVTLLNEGEKAPYKGYLFDQEKAEKVRLLNLKLDSETQINTLLQKENDIYVQRVDNMREQNDKLATTLAQERDSSIWSKIGFFLLGAAVTVGVTYGVSRTIK